MISRPSDAAVLMGPIPGEPVWAVCPRADKVGDETPKRLFHSEAQANRFLKRLAPWPKARLQERKQVLEQIASGKLHELDFPQHLVRTKNSDRFGPLLQLVGITESSTRPPLSFRDFLPVGEVGTIPEDNLDDLLEKAFEGRSTECSYLLADEWKFSEIDKHARALEGHEFSGRKHGSVAEIALKAVYDFQVSLELFQPGLSAESTADFFGSWQLWRHIAVFCKKLGQSAVGRSLSRNAEFEANGARDFLYTQLSAYASKVRPRRAAATDDHILRSDQQGQIACPQPVTGIGKDVQSRCAESERDVGQISVPNEKGNVAILRGTDGNMKTTVTLDVAGRFGGVTKRAIEKAVRKGSLESEGVGQKRRIIVLSLLKYFPVGDSAN